MAAVFVPRSSKPSVLHAHLPLLTYTASVAHARSQPTRLVSLPKDSEARLCDALALPRVNFVGLLDDAPHATPLLAYIRQHVPAIDVPWLRHDAAAAAAGAHYLPVRINALQTTMPILSKTTTTTTTRKKEAPRGPGGVVVDSQQQQKQQKQQHHKQEEEKPRTEREKGKKKTKKVGRTDGRKSPLKGRRTGENERNDIATL